MKRSKKGVFIAIEGTDGSGKTTQFKLLVSALRRRGLKVETLDFPQYGKPSAYFVEQYLNGEYGRDVSPYIASLFYSLDRYSIKQKLHNWLKQGKVVIANRFTLSNAAHQGGKLKTMSATAKYWQWLFNLENEILGLPRPDITILLHMPVTISQKLILKKSPRKYIKNGDKKDIHEADLKHLKAAELRYLKLASLVKAEVINCVASGKLLTPKEIHRKVLLKVGLLIKTKINKGEKNEKKEKSSVKARARYAKNKLLKSFRVLSEAAWAFKKIPNRRPAKVVFEEEVSGVSPIM